MLAVPVSLSTGRPQAGASSASRAACRFLSTIYADSTRSAIVLKPCASLPSLPVHCDNLSLPAQAIVSPFACASNAYTVPALKQINDIKTTSAPSLGTRINAVAYVAPLADVRCSRSVVNVPMHTTLSTVAPHRAPAAGQHLQAQDRAARFSSFGWWGDENVLFSSLAGDRQVGKFSQSRNRTGGSGRSRGLPVSYEKWT